jgi:hypothetical protein
MEIQSAEVSRHKTDESILPLKIISGGVLPEYREYPVPEGCRSLVTRQLGYSLHGTSRVVAYLSCSPFLHDRWAPRVPYSKVLKQSGETHLTGGKMKSPKPIISSDLACQIRQTNVAINFAEAEGDLRLMIQAMAERENLFQQAVEESAKWYNQSFTTADKQ